VLTSLAQVAIVAQDRRPVRRSTSSSQQQMDLDPWVYLRSTCLRCSGQYSALLVVVLASAPSSTPHQLGGRRTLVAGCGVQLELGPAMEALFLAQQPHRRGPAGWARATTTTAAALGAPAPGASRSPGEKELARARRAPPAVPRPEAPSQPALAL